MLAAVCALPQPGWAAKSAEIIVSLRSHALQLRHPSGRVETFPAAVGRLRRGRRLGPRGRWYTGPDASDHTFYLPQRRLPAFHRGLPFLRLSPVRLSPRRSDPAYKRAASQEYGLHGPVTPSLIWGAITAGCVRLRAADLKRVFAFAKRYPGIAVRYTRAPVTVSLGRGGCPEAQRGVARMTLAPLNRQLHGRVCGGVDRWFAVELQGGDVLDVQLLQRAGGLRVELYGIRAISTVTRGGVAGLRYRVPLARRSRGWRYLRLVAPETGTVGFSLRVQRLR